MALGRSLLCGGALLLCLTGCASMQNTVAQDLAWERWRKCDQLNTGVRLKEIRTNGDVWVEYSGSSQFANWNECMRRAQQEQAATSGITTVRDTARTAAIVPAVAVASPQPADAMSVPPLWKPGDEWAYRYESPSGNGTYIWSVDREDAIDGVPHYVIKTGTREIFYRKSDFASTREIVDGAIVVNTKPSRLSLVWPLVVGKTWEQTYVEERPVARQTTERIDAVTIEAEETVTVPAGTLKTLKVVYRNKRTGAIRYEAWYSPELKQVVKLRENLETGTRIRELIAFKLR